MRGSTADNSSVPWRPIKLFDRSLALIVGKQLVSFDYVRLYFIISCVGETDARDGARSRMLLGKLLTSLQRWGFCILFTLKFVDTGHASCQLFDLSNSEYVC